MLQSFHLWDLQRKCIHFSLRSFLYQNLNIILQNKFKEELTRKSGSLFGRTATQPQDGGNDFEMVHVPQREIHSENGIGINCHITENPILNASITTNNATESTRTELRKSQSVKAVRFKSYSLRDKRLGTRV